MKTTKLFCLVLMLMLITFGCKKKEPQPTRQVPVEDEKKTATKPIETTPPVVSIHEAAAAGDIEQIKALISGGADLNEKDNSGSTPLHYAVILAKKDSIELLISNGADVNAKDNEGRTPLAWAKEIENNEIADLLRKHGAKE